MGLHYAGQASTPVSVFFLVHRGSLALHKPLASRSSWGWVGQVLDQEQLRSLDSTRKHLACHIQARPL